MSEVEVLDVLGEPAAHYETAAGGLALADLISGGLRQRALQRVKAALELSDVEIGAVIGMSQKTIGRLRKKPDAPLGLVPSDRLYRLASLYALAREVFGDPAIAREWLKTPQPGLNGRVPLELVRTEVGAREVENLLGRLEYGVLT